MYIMTLDSISPLMFPVNRLPQTRKHLIFHKYESYTKDNDMLNGKRLCIGLHTNDNKVKNCSSVNIVGPPMLQN
jgi:hypothetical protein